MFETDLTPLILSEVLLLTLVVFAGAGAMWHVGVRRPTLMLVLGTLSAIGLRTVTFLIDVGFNVKNDSKQVWIVSLSVLGVATFVGACRSSVFWKAIGIGLSGIAASLVSKHILQVGERFHEDSAQLVARTILMFSEDVLSAEVKRGLALPVMLSTGQPGTIFTLFLPFIFFLLVALAVDLTKLLSGKRFSTWTNLGLFTVLAAVSISTPMIRVLPFYINSHTLVALGVGAVIFATIQSVSLLRFSLVEAIAVAAGGAAITAARFEGIIIFLVALVPLISHIHLLGRKSHTLLTISCVPGITLWSIWAWVSGYSWFLGTNSTLLLVAPMLLAAIATIGYVAPLKVVQKLAFPIALGLLLLPAGFLIATRSGSLDAQVRNLILGLGGWGFTAPAFLLLMILILPGNRDRRLSTLMKFFVLAVVGTIAIKFFDQAGLGRQGFNDSINRAWSHWLVLWWVLPHYGLLLLTHPPESPGPFRTRDARNVPTGVIKGKT